MKFCVETWEKMQQKTKNQLTDTAQNFFNLLEQFAKLKKKSLHEQIDTGKWCAKSENSNCGSFQLYFYKNLFDPDENNKIINHKTLNKSTLQTTINENL